MQDKTAQSMSFFFFYQLPLFCFFWLVTPVNPSALASFSADDSGVLYIDVQNLRSAEGKVWIGLYEQHNFLDRERAIVKGYLIPKAGQLEIALADLEYGTYALAVFHDENDNGEMDRNLVGVPSEPFAFSGQLVSRFRIPRFEEVNFTFSEDGQRLVTPLRKWWQQ